MLTAILPGLPVPNDQSDGMQSEYVKQFAGLAGSSRFRFGENHPLARIVTRMFYFVVRDVVFKGDADADAKETVVVKETLQA